MTRREVVLERDACRVAIFHLISIAFAAGVGHGAQCKKANILRQRSIVWPKNV